MCRLPGCGKRNGQRTPLVRVDRRGQILRGSGWFSLWPGSAFPAITKSPGTPLRYGWGYWERPWPTAFPACQFAFASHRYCQQAPYVFLPARLPEVLDSGQKKSRPGRTAFLVSGRDYHLVTFRIWVGLSPDSLVITIWYRPDGNPRRSIWILLFRLALCSLPYTC